MSDEFQLTNPEVEEIPYPAEWVKDRPKEECWKTTKRAIIEVMERTDGQGPPDHIYYFRTSEFHLSGPLETIREGLARLGLRMPPGA